MDPKRSWMMNLLLGNPDAPGEAAPMVDPTGGYQSGDMEQTATPGQTPPLRDAVAEALAMPQQQRIMATAAELTGVPSMIRGAERIQNAGRGDNSQQYDMALGAGEAALGALPAVGVAAKAIPAIGGALFGGPIRSAISTTVPLATGATVTTATAREAELKADKAAAAEKAATSRRYTPDDSNPDFTLLRQQLTDEALAADPEGKRLLANVQAAQQRLARASGQEVAGSKQMNARNAMIAGAQGEVATAEAALAEARARIEGAARERATAIITARGNAQQAADQARANLPPTTYQQYKQLQEKNPWLPPMSALPPILGALVGAVPAMGKAAAGWVARSKASGALTEAQAAQRAMSTAATPEIAAQQQGIANQRLGYAEAMADNHAASSDVLSKSLVGPAVVGSLAAAAPRGMDAYSQPDINPSYTAQEAYATGLAEQDPIRQREMDRLRDGSIPMRNPARAAATDPIGYAQNLAFGALEGAAGAKAVGAMGTALTPQFSLVRSEIDALARNMPRNGGVTPPPSSPPSQPQGAIGATGSAPGGAPPGAALGVGQQGYQSPTKLNGGPGQVQQTSYAPYDRSVYGNQSDAFIAQQLDSVLAPLPRAQRLQALEQMQGGQWAADLARRYQAAGLPPVDPMVLTARAQGTISELIKAERMLTAGQTNRSVSQPAMRNPIMRAATDQEHTLALPLAIGAGGAAAMDPMTRALMGLPPDPGQDGMTRALGY